MTDTQPLVRIATRRGVATLTLDSPRNRNALSTALLTELRQALAHAVADPAVRVIVLDHAGPAFCSGIDLTEAGADPGSGPAPMAMLPDLLVALRECPLPVVARIAGPVRAGGIGLVAAADIAIAATDATFAFSEVRLGVIPAVISALVLPLLTTRAAARLYLTGEVFDAEHAALVGLVTEAVPASQLDSALSTTCAALLRGAPTALTGAKELLREAALAGAGELPRPAGAPDLRTVLAELSARSAAYFRSAEAREGIAALREQRDPSWVAPSEGQR